MDAETLAAAAEAQKPLIETRSPKRRGLGVMLTPIAGKRWPDSSPI